MANIIILGAGVMGSALTVPASDNGHHVTLVGTHLDKEQHPFTVPTHYHPGLDAQLPASVMPLHFDQLSRAMLQQPMY